mgnify:CR=1 FL=1
MVKDFRQIEKELNVRLFLTERNCQLLNTAQNMLTRERIAIRDEKKILIPGCNMLIVKNEAIDACVRIMDDEYYILINSGIVEQQREYLEKLDWSFISNKVSQEKYINDMIEYGFYFSVFHEYAHIFCGHTEACFEDSADRKAQECEADMFAMDYLIKYIVHTHPVETDTIELEKMFLAIYFQFENMQKESWAEWYNDKILENYYNLERIEKRDHPLASQRILYLYEMLSIVVITDKMVELPVRGKILEKIRKLKRTEGKEISEWKIGMIDDSVQKLKESVKQIRVKIPRMEEDLSEDVVHSGVRPHEQNMNKI